MNENLDTIKAELREKFEELKTEHNLDWKDEFQILGMLLDDLSIAMPGVPEITLVSRKK